MSFSKIEWVIDLQSMVNKKVKLETLEGFIREATLTAVTFQKIEVDGFECGLPLEVQLNDEDKLPFSQLKYIKRA